MKLMTKQEFESEEQRLALAICEAEASGQPELQRKYTEELIALELQYFTFGLA